MPDFLLYTWSDHLPVFNDTHRTALISCRLSWQHSRLSWKKEFCSIPIYTTTLQTTHALIKYPTLFWRILLFPFPRVARLVTQSPRNRLVLSWNYVWSFGEGHSGEWIWIPLWMLTRTPTVFYNTTPERMEEWPLYRDTKFLDPEDHSLLKINQDSVSAGKERFESGRYWETNVILSAKLLANII